MHVRQQGRRRLALAAMVLVAFGAGAGCDSFNSSRGRGDAPVGKFDDSAAEVVNFPDKFANVAHKCDGHGHRIYSTTREATVVVIDDPSCDGGTPE
jgi:hypothetical protein